MFVFVFVFRAAELRGGLLEREGQTGRRRPTSDFRLLAFVSFFEKTVFDRSGKYQKYEVSPNRLLSRIRPLAKVESSTTKRSSLSTLRLNHRPRDPAPSMLSTSLSQLPRLATSGLNMAMSYVRATGMSPASRAVPPFAVATRRAMRAAAAKDDKATPTPAPTTKETKEETQVTQGNNAGVEVARQSDFPLLDVIPYPFRQAVRVACMHACMRTRAAHARVVSAHGLSLLPVPA